MRDKTIVIVLSIMLIFIPGCGEMMKNVIHNPQLTMAWIYPGDNVCSNEIAKGRKIDVLKPEYYTLRDNGTLKRVTDGCDAYSEANVALVKQYSKKQFVTISGTITGMARLVASRNLTNVFIRTMVSFLGSSGFSGIELDFEGFSQWMPEQYEGYKQFVRYVGDALHLKGYKLMIDGPAISDTTYQGYYLWKWEDFAALPVDYLVVMAYDYQYDQGVGAPVAPLHWLQNICQWMETKIADRSKIVVGLNSYGYHGPTNGSDFTLDTYVQSMLFPGFRTAKRDANSGEMMWEQEGVFYDYSDSTTLRGKINVVLGSGLSTISVWHLGGNQWFDNTVSNPQPPTGESTPTPTSP